MVFRNRDSEHPVIHIGLNKVHHGVLRQSEALNELSTGELDAVPASPLLLLLDALPAHDAEHPVVVDLHAHVVALVAREVRIVNVRLRGLLPLYEGGVEHRRGVTGEGHEGGWVVGLGNSQRVVMVLGLVVVPRGLVGWRVVSSAAEEATGGKEGHFFLCGCVSG